MSQPELHPSQTLKQEISKRGNFIVQNMKDNIKELNRSMSSIEKMIAQSRKIIQQSRENSLNKSLEIQRKGNSPYKQRKLVNISNSPRTSLPTAKKTPQHSQTQQGQRQTQQGQRQTQQGQRQTQQSQRISIAGRYQPSSNHQSTNRSNNSRNSNFSFGFTSKFNTISHDKISDKHQQNLIRFQPKNIKKEIQLRRSGVRNSNSGHSNKQSSRIHQLESERLNGLKQQPYEKTEQNGNQVYLFSPQRTATQTTHKRNKDTNTKIKLRPTPRNGNPPLPTPTKNLINIQPCPESSSNSEMIKIQDDDYEEAPLNNLSNSREIYQQLSVRFKTQYTTINKTEEDQQEQSAVKKYQFSSPKASNHFDNSFSSARNKINLKLFQDQSARKEKSIQSILSYRDQNKKSSRVDMVTSTPRDQSRQILVKQLQKLQTKSASEEQRKAKFILKIRKYGFVEKYLTETEIWSIYDHLVWTNVPELKWPIYIVDEVYKKMKTLN